MIFYPIKFTPLYKYRIWGGNKLKTVLNKNYNQESIGESWEISDVLGDETVVSEGPLKGKNIKELIRAFKGDIVHPGNEIAKERHNSFGKNEMWYVMEAEEDAELIVGFNQKIDKESYIKALESKKILEILNNDKVTKGDSYYIPTGRIHAIGSGVLLAEIQQTSDITYRIYDYDEKRELHTDLAVDVIDYNAYDCYKTKHLKPDNETNKLIHTPYFKTNILNIKGGQYKDYSGLDSFVIYICVEGELELRCKGKGYSLTKGETLFLPALLDTIELKSKNADVLEVYF